MCALNDGSKSECKYDFNLVNSLAKAIARANRACDAFAAARGNTEGRALGVFGLSVNGGGRKGKCICCGACESNFVRTIATIAAIALVINVIGVAAGASGTVA